MPKARPYHHALNVGVVDRTALARVDLERMRLAAEDQTNLLPTTTGRAFFRPGTEFIGNTRQQARGRLKAFVRSTTSVAMLEFTPYVMRVRVNDQLVTREAVSSSVQNGDFDASAGWTLASSDGQSTSISNGTLILLAQSKGGAAWARQQVSTSSAGKRHALRIHVARGPVSFRCGSSQDADDLIAETQLATGFHSLAFTPSGASFWIRFGSDDDVFRIVDSVQVEEAGVMTLPTIWADPDALRFAQSIDVMYVASGQRQYRIERRDDHSWSVVQYVSDDGPFAAYRTSPVRLKPGATSGNTTLTADKPFFRQSHIGALFRLFHDGQIVVQGLAGEDQYTDPIRVTGIHTDAYSDRNFGYSISGTFSGTLKLYRSVDGEDFGYREYASVTTGSPQTVTTDEDSNAIVWYRIGFAEGQYTSGEAAVGLSYLGGGGFGICRVIGYTSPTQVDIEILRPFRNRNYTADWREGEWSDARGWPTAVALTEGRLWWGGQDKYWGSVSDAFNSFDEEVEGDAGPVLKTIAIDGANQIVSLLPLTRLLALTDGSEVSIRSSSFDEPLTPTNATAKPISTYGSAPVDAVKVDGRGMFVNKALTALMEVVYSVEAGDFLTSDMSRLCSTFFASGIRSVAVQRQPDTRIWVVMNDGSLMSILYEPQQEVIAFAPIETEGRFEDVEVLPARDQDRVYFIVNRGTSSDIRYIEKMARDVDALPGSQAMVMDCFKAGTQTASTTISGAAHLSGRSVKVWADGAPITETVVIEGDEIVRPKLFPVDVFGNINGLPVPVTNYVYGLPYEARYKSARLAYGAVSGAALVMKKRVNDLGLILSDYVRPGFRHGRDFEHLDPLPILKGGVTAQNVNLGAVDDEGPVVFDGQWDTDSRVCFTAEWPVSVLGMVFSVEANE